MPPDPGPPPRSTARRELLRALGGAALAPLRVADYLLCRDAHARATAEALGSFQPSFEAPDVDPPADRPLRVFLSCAEASGEMHARNLARALRKMAEDAGAPEPELAGFGSPRLAAEGVETLADPIARAEMGFDVWRNVPYYVDLLETAARAFQGRRPDVFVPVDSPALHVPMARAAKRYGVPTVHFIAPQYWAWAPWRVHAYAEAVDRVLTILPFEPAWFDRYGVASGHVGHPILDELADIRPAEGGGGRRSLAILPGSRRTIIRRNLPWMLRVAAAFEETHPGVDVVVGQGSDDHASLVREILESGTGRAGSARFEVGDLHATLGRARAALSVSGTILMDLLHHRLPTVVVYRSPGRLVSSAIHLLTTPQIASVNLIAGEEVLPEFCFHGDGPEREVGHLLGRCYNDDGWRARCRAGLDRAARRLGPPGAVDRAARHVVEVAVGGSA